MKTLSRIGSGPSSMVRARQHIAVAPFVVLLFLTVLGCGGAPTFQRSSTTLARPVPAQTLKEEVVVPDTTHRGDRTTISLEGSTSVDGRDQRLCFTVEDYQGQNIDPAGQSLKSLFTDEVKNPLQEPGAVFLQTSDRSEPFAPALLNGLSLDRVEWSEPAIDPDTDGPLLDPDTGEREYDEFKYWKYGFSACFGGAAFITPATEWIELRARLHYGYHSYRFNIAHGKNQTDMRGPAGS